MRLSLCSLAVAGLVVGASAAMAAPAKLSKADIAKLKAALKDVKKADKRKDRKAAAAAYERALAIKKEDPRLLSELGLELYLAKDLPRAEEVTRRAVAASNYEQKGAPLYNLGLILLAKNDKPGAIAAYKESLGVRPNAVVRAALAKLDAKAATDFDPLSPKPMAGPFTSLEAYCDQLDDKAAHDRKVCPTAADAFEKKPDGLAKPWLDVRVFAASEWGECSLGVKTDRGWFVLADQIDCNDYHHRGEVQDFAVDTAAQGKPIVLSVVGHWTGRDDVELDDGSHGSTEIDMGSDTTTVMCGLGAGKTPSCFQLVSAADTDSDDNPDWELVIDLTKPGEVSVTAKGKAPPDAKAYVGKRAFTWP